MYSADVIVCCQLQNGALVNGCDGRIGFMPGRSTIVRMTNDLFSECLTDQQRRSLIRMGDILRA